MQTSSAAETALSSSAQDVCIAPFRRDSLDSDKKAVRTGDLGAFTSRLIPFEHIV